MFKGTVKFVAKISKYTGVTFPLFDFDPNEPGVDKVEIEGLRGAEIRSTVHLASVATRKDGWDYAGVKKCNKMLVLWTTSAL
jgi:hypothetical protein